MFLFFQYFGIRFSMEGEIEQIVESEPNIESAREQGFVSENRMGFHPIPKSMNIVPFWM